jgi:hypothetical protein
MAQRVQDRRAERESETGLWQEERAGHEALETNVIEFFDWAGALFLEAMLAAGLHLHKRQWRKRRIKIMDQQLSSTWRTSGPPECRLT